MGSYKDNNGTTKIGDFLRGAAPHILDIVGDVLPSNGALGIVKNLIQKDDKLTAHEKVEALRLLELDLDNVKDARSMQKAALNQEDKFSKRFLYYLSTFWSLVAASYFFLATFSSVVNDKIADIILGFLLGSVVGVMMNFFYGDSHKVK
tara:strand:- start:2167 stop:2613 length:447 start_codon:yes stop_codon:yes gene_type:complete